MSRSNKRKGEWLYRNVEPGDEVGGIIIDAVFKYKTEGGWNVSMLIGKVAERRVNYDRKRTLGLFIHMGNNHSIHSYLYNRRKTLRAKIKSIIETYPPDKASRFMNL